jgi:methyl-accepting chemotaxis protein
MALSFKKKIMFGFLAAGVLPMALYAMLAIYMSYQTGMTTSGQTLYTLEKGFADRVEKYFETIHAQARTEAGSPEAVDALMEFREALKTFDVAAVQVDSAKLQERYQVQEQKTPGAQPGDAARWLPTDPKTRALQHLYVSGNPNALGEKQKLEDAGDGSAYSQVHAKYHPGFRDFVEEFGFYDIFLVDAETGYIVYSDFKEIDFMTSVKQPGPLYDSSLHQLARKIMEHGNAELSMMTDFAPYMPSYNDHAAFVGVPIVANGKTEGALMLQMPVGVMNQMFAKLKEFGETADGYLFAADGTYRTQPLRDEGKKIGDTVPDGMKDLVTKVFAAEGFEGSAEWYDRSGELLLGAIGKVSVPMESGHGLDPTKTKKLDWAVAVSTDEHEVLAPVYKQIWMGLAAMVAFATVSTLAGLYAGRVFTQPIIQLASSFTTSSKQVNQSTGEVTEAVAGLVAASEETATQSKVIRQNSAEAASYVKNVANAVGELNISINDISQSIGEVNSLVDDAVGKAKKTDEVVRNLGEAAKKISDVVNLINGLAEQTNLLALNAAIEAARAGDAGRGFAVVADEVKKLATHTSEATVEIGDQVKSIQEVSEESVMALQSVVEAIHRIRDSATTVSAAVEEQSGVAKQIAGSVEDASNRVQQVDTNMSGIEQATNDTGVAANQVSGAADDVKAAFSKLDTEVNGVLTTLGVKSDAA